MRAGDLERVVEGHENRLMALLELGDVAGAKADLTAMAKLAEELRQPSQHWLLAVYRALFALLEGRFAEGEELISAARRQGERAQAWNAAVTYRLQLYLLRRDQGRLEEVEPTVLDSAAAHPTYPIWRCVHAHMAAELGDTVTSEGAFVALAADGFTALPFDEEWLVSMSLLAETAVALGATRQAAVLYGLLHPFADRVAVAAPEIAIGSVSRYLGILATAMERWAEAARQFENALEMNEHIGARPWVARTQLDHARMLLARGHSGDARRARALRERAIATAEELGMSALTRSAQAR